MISKNRLECSNHFLVIDGWSAKSHVMQSRRVIAIEGLLRAGYIAHVGIKSEAHPQFQIAGVRQVLKAADLTKHARAHNHFRRTNAVLDQAASDVEPFAAAPNGPSRGGIRRLRARLMVRKNQRFAIDEAHPRMRLHQSARSRERSRRQQIIGADEHEVFSAGHEHAFVVCAKGAEVDAMTHHIDSAMPSRKGGSHLRGVVGGSIVNDQDTYVDTGLANNALHTLRQVVAIVVAGDSDAYGWQARRHC